MEKAKYLVLDHGLVVVDRVNGSEEDVLRWVKGDPYAGVKPSSHDLGFRYLIQNQHKAPFGFLDLIFWIKAPLFVRAGIFQVKTAWKNDGQVVSSLTGAGQTITPTEPGPAEYYGGAPYPGYQYTSWWWKQNLWDLLEWSDQASERSASEEERSYRQIIQEVVEERFPRVWSAWRWAHGPRLDNEDVKELATLLDKKIVSSALARKLGIGVNTGQV